MEYGGVRAGKTERVLTSTNRKPASQLDRETQVPQPLSVNILLIDLRTSHWASSLRDRDKPLALFVKEFLVWVS